MDIPTATTKAGLIFSSKSTPPSPWRPIQSENIHSQLLFTSINFNLSLLINSIIRSGEAGLYDKWKMYALIINGYVGDFDEPPKVLACEFNTINMKQAIDEFYLLVIGIFLSSIMYFSEIIWFVSSDPLNTAAEKNWCPFLKYLDKRRSMRRASNSTRRYWISTRFWLHMAFIYFSYLAFNYTKLT